MTRLKAESDSKDKAVDMVKAAVVAESTHGTGLGEDQPPDQPVREKIRHLLRQLPATVRRGGFEKGRR